MDIQREISLRKNEALVGKTLKVLFDRREAGYFIGRTEFDSPEVDNEVHVAIADGLDVGMFAEVFITEATEYDLIGEVAGAEHTDDVEVPVRDERKKLQ